VKPLVSNMVFPLAYLSIYEYILTQHAQVRVWMAEHLKLKDGY